LTGLGATQRLPCKPTEGSHNESRSPQPVGSIFSARSARLDRYSVHHTDEFTFEAA
jgi:hypothetical protein